MNIVHGSISPIWVLCVVANYSIRQAHHINSQKWYCNMQSFSNAKLCVLPTFTWHHPNYKLRTHGETQRISTLIGSTSMLRWNKSSFVDWFYAYHTYIPYTYSTYFCTYSAHLPRPDNLCLTTIHGIWSFASYHITMSIGYIFTCQYVCWNSVKITFPMHPPPCAPQPFPLS